MPDLFATEDEDLKKLLNAEDGDLIGRMKSILGPFILRRLKSDVMQQLVPKIQRVCWNHKISTWIFCSPIILLRFYNEISNPFKFFYEE